MKIYLLRNKTEHTVYERSQLIMAFPTNMLPPSTA